MREFRVIDKNSKKALRVEVPLAMLAMDGRFFIYNQVSSQFIDMTKYVWVDQAIGINAENGKTRVFENDIVEVDLEVPFGEDTPPILMKAIAVIQYDYAMSGYGLDIIDQDLKHILANGCRWYVKRVLGDTHRNPEIITQYKPSKVYA